jgi:hypothetical protein
MRLSQREREIAFGLWFVPRNYLRPGCKIALSDIVDAIYKDRVACRRSAKGRAARARVFAPAKSTIARVLKRPRTPPAKSHGRTPLLHPVTVRKLPRIIRKLESANPEDTVTAAMIREELAGRIAKMNATGRHAEQQVPVARHT